MAKKTAATPKVESESAINPAKASSVIPNTGKLEQADVSKDGINIKQSLGALKLVDIADVDLLLTFANGERIVIPNGALEAVSSTPPTAIFNDQKIPLPDLLKYVGLTYQAKPGSLRLVSENIDANPPSDINTSDQEPTPVNPPPAPIVKVSPGTGIGKGLANGLGDVPDTYVPLVTAQPAVYRIGASPSTPINDLIGAPNFDVNVFTSNEFKVSPSGRIDAPLGAFVPDATPQELITRSNPASQSTREVINGTSGADNIVHNGNFALDSQWAKSIYATISNISPTQPITISIDQAKLALMPGFDLVGTGITHEVGSNTWSIDPTLISDSGLDFKVIYDIDTRINPVTVNFVADVNIKGTSGPFSLDYTKQIYFTYRDVDANTADFTVTDPLTGKQMFVLPSKGLGVDIRSGTGDDLITAGAGNDWINAGEGADTVNGGIGQDTITYDNSSAAIQVDLRSTAAQTSTGDASGDILSNIENVTGSNFDDRITGSQVNNVLKGLDGNDTLVSIGRNNTLDGGSGTDTASYEFNDNGIDVSLRTNTSSNGDKLVSIENLTGSSFDDTLEGNAGANHFDGGAHGANGDTVSYANSPVVANSSNLGVVASLSGYTFTNFSSNQSSVVATGDAVSDTFSNIENITGSAFNDTLIGDASSNTLKGGAGNDILEGLAGADKLIGGSGTDTASYAFADAGVIADLSGLFVAANLQQGDAQGDTFDTIENLTGSKFDDTLIGDLSNNIINAGDGNDVLEGLAGADTFIGGDGTDTVTYVNSTGSVNASLTNNLSGFSSTGDAFGDTFNSIENLTGSKFDDTLIGDSGVNIINGGEGNDILEGMSGADRLEGGSGSNTASYANYVSITNQGVIASLESNAAKMASTTSTSVIDDITYITGGSITFGTLTSDNVDIVNDAAGDVYLNIQNLIGSQYDDILTGSYTQTSNTIVDRSKIEGGAGNDTIYTALIGNVEIRGGTGNDTVIVTNYLDNKQDILDGGDGVDTFVYNGNVIVYNLDMGKDGLGTFSPNNIRSYEQGSTLGGLGSFVTLQNFENITINNGGFGGTIIASNLDNIITVTNATQKTISYQHAISGVKVNLSTDLTDPNTTNVSGGSGNDRIVGFSNVNGSAFNDEITGDNTNNVLNGGAGADRIDGRSGNDTVSYSDSSSAVNVDLRITSAQSTNNNGHASGDTLINIEHITGSSFNDNLIANNDAVQNILSGGNGDDTLRGFANDILYGQNGNDTFNINLSSLPSLIWGEAGNDTIKVEGGITTANAAGMFASLSGGRSFQNEVINVRDGATHTFNIDAGTIQNIVDAGVSSKLTILADRGDVIKLTSSQYFDGNQSFNQLTQTNTNDTYLIFSGGAATSTAISVVWA